MFRCRLKYNRIRFLIVVTCLVFAIIHAAYSEEKPSKLSGIIVTADGEPLREVPILLSYVEIDKIKGGTIDLSTGFPAETDLEGKFSFSEITPGLVQFRVKSKQETHSGVFLSSPSRIREVNFRKMKFYPHFSGFPHLGRVTFSVKPGADIKNVVIIMEDQLRMQGKILFKDGSPLSKTSAKFDFNQLSEVRTGKYVFKRTSTLLTNADGNFYHWVYAPGIYVISIKHNGLSASSEPFLLEKNRSANEIVLRLDGNPIDMSAPIQEQPKKEEQYRPSYIPDFPAAWIMNPDNGHVYKWIACDGREDAQKQAADEKAYLVTITSEAEQIWLESVFGFAPYWIGLTDKKDEGKWRWENGELVTYTNWKPKEFNPLRDDDVPAVLNFFGVKGEDQKRQEDEEDYVLMSGGWDFWDKEIGNWVKSDSIRDSYIAIIEKEGLTTTTLIEKK